MSVVAIALFADEGPYLRARARAVADERRIVGEWMPYASDALGHGEGEKGILPGVVIGGAVGGLGLFAIASWSSGIAYPINSGARALWSWQAFIPAPVEFAALAGAIVGTILLFVRARLTRLNDAAFDFDEIAHASRDSFVLALGCDAGADAKAALALLTKAGATHSRLVGA